MKVVLILADGMRPDSFIGNEYAEKLKKESTYCLSARTVMPSVTLPCHMSLFHSVDPQRHGISTNTYTPMVRPINGLCEQLNLAKKKSAFFYDWEQLRDLTLPGSLSKSVFYSGQKYGYDVADIKLTTELCEYLNSSNDADFSFLYLCAPDEHGHNSGWMTEEYLNAVKRSWTHIETVIESLEEDYTVIVTADHGGHDRIHGTEDETDMLIPMFFKGKCFKKNNPIEGVSIKDIAPTIAKILEVENAVEWEGKSLV